MGSLVIVSAGTTGDILSDVPAQSLLVNVPWVEKNYAAFQSLMRRANWKRTMLDSGGYQLFLAEHKAGFNPIFDERQPLSISPWSFNITPKHVVDVAERINPDIVMASDFPIRKLTGNDEQQKEFFRKLQFNREWAHRTSDLMIERGLDTTRLFIPVQCYTLSQFNIFRRLIHGCAFGGMSMPVRNLSLQDIYYFLLEMYDCGVTRIHLLGTTAAKIIALAAYMARHFFRWVSLDSTTWRSAADYGKYLASEDLRQLNVGRQAPINPRTLITCRCKWCRYYMDYGSIIDMDHVSKLSFLHRHNIMATDTFARTAYLNSTSAASLESFVNSRFRNQRFAQEIVKVVNEAERHLWTINARNLQVA